MQVQNDLSFDDGCYLAAKAKDARFDGSFFTAVTSTGIYCRPVCRVKTPKRENCRFFTLAAQAEAAGFRPCMRCRPELAPANPALGQWAWSTQDASNTLALQAAALLSQSGFEARNMGAVAGQLGISERHLRRIFDAHLGVSPLQYLQTRRLLTAKQLLTDTQLSVLQVALTSGFESLRRFNAAFVAHYRMPPTRLRKAALAGATEPQAGACTVRLAYRPPYDVDSLLKFWQQREISAIENIATNARGYWTNRTFSCQNPSFDQKTAILGTGGAPLAALGQAPRLSGWVGLQFDAEQPLVRLQVSDALVPALPAIMARVRSAHDLDCDPLAVDSALAGHFPTGQGLRVPGALNGFEVAVRAVLGQQVTVAAGRTFTERVVAQFGEPIATPWPGLNRLFPTPQALAQAAPEALGELGIVKQRQQALIALGRAVASGQLQLDAHTGMADVQATMAQLLALPGVGPWTANYIAMRALRWPDAFPAGDVVLHKAFGIPKSARAAAQAEALSQAWRPWRSYAVLRAWAGHYAQPGAAQTTTESTP